MIGNMYGGAHNTYGASSVAQIYPQPRVIQGRGNGGQPIAPSRSPSRTPSTPSAPGIPQPSVPVPDPLLGPGYTAPQTVFPSYVSPDLGQGAFGMGERVPLYLQPAPPEIDEDDEDDDEGMPMISVILGTLVVAGAAYGAWQWYQKRGG
jgi:hypothetical protein